jgi:DNA ligase-1
MKFSELATYFEKIEKTSSRLTITEVLADLFKKLHVDEIDKAIYLLQGRVVPLYEKIEFGMAEKMVLKSVMNALQLDKQTVDAEFRKFGDTGKAVFQLKQEIKSLDEEDLSVREVFNQLYKLATAGGAGSQEVKINILSHLIRQLDPLAACYLVRIPTGTMRLGFSDMTILDALSWMSVGNKSLRPVIERAFHVRPDLGFIGHIMKEKGESGLKSVQPQPFTPILMRNDEARIF